VLLLSGTTENAIRWVGMIGDIILYNEKYNYFFPEVRPKDPSRMYWREGAIKVNRDKFFPEPTLEGMGIEANIVGRHYDVIVYDDIVNEVNSASTERLERIKRAYESSLAVLEPSGGQVVIGTRWDHNDVYGDILDNPEFNKSIRQVTEDRDGKTVFIFPQKFNEAYLNSLKRSMSRYLFSCQYYNQPVLSEDRLFTEKMIKYYEELPDQPGLFYITVDPASSTKSSADYSCIMVCYWVGMCNEYPNGAIFVYDYVVGRYAPAQLVQLMINKYLFYRPHLMSIEIAGNSGALWDFFMQEMMKRGIHATNIQKFTPPTNQSKYERIAMLQPYFARGDIYIKKEHKELEMQMLHYTGFKKTEHDDILDALAQQLFIGKFPDMIEEQEEYDYEPLFDSTGY